MLEISRFPNLLIQLQIILEAMQYNRRNIMGFEIRQTSPSLSSLNNLKITYHIVDMRFNEMMICVNTQSRDDINYISINSSFTSFIIYSNQSYVIHILPQCPSPIVLLWRTRTQTILLSTLLQVEEGRALALPERRQRSEWKGEEEVAKY